MIVYIRNCSLKKTFTICRLSYIYSISQENILIQLYICITEHRKYLAVEKMANLANRELFAKIFLGNIHTYTENIFGICTDCSLFAYLPTFPCQQLLPVAMVCQNFPLPNISRVRYFFLKRNNTRKWLQMYQDS